MENITSELVNKAGVRPCPDWLSACQEYLQQTNTQGTDGILHQILHSDLRDVVRPKTASSGTVPHQSSVLLKEATQQSMTNDSRKSTLESSFQLMIQIEELLDVSLNAETRLEQGPAPQSAPTPIGNQQKRCLKLAITDGHLPATLELVAMEVVPIPNLSVNSRAGIKVLLKGAIEIRYGILLLTPQNAFVLGGSVAHLVEVQTKAIALASHVAGVGIDPTMRALVWNPMTGNEQEEEGEGEGASGDVVASPTNHNTAPPVQQQLQQQQQQQPPVQQRRQKQQPPIQQQRRQQQPRSTFQNNDFNPATVPPPQAPPPRPMNAYVRQTPSTNTPVVAVQQQRAGVRPNPYARSSATSSRQQGPDTMSDENMRPPSSNAKTAAATTTTNRRSAPTSQQPASQTSNGSSTSSSSSSVMKYEDFAVKVQHMSSNQQLYQESEAKIFTVQARVYGQQRYFDIKKKKKVKKTDGKEYEYVLNASLGGATRSSSSTPLTTKFAGSTLSPHFSLSAGQMRKLSKTDRAKSNSLVAEGGRRVMEELKKELKPWRLKLILSAQEFFAAKPSLDGNDPIFEALE